MPTTDLTADTIAVLRQGTFEVMDWLIVLPVVIAIVGGGCLLLLRDQTRSHPLLAYLTILAILIDELFLLTRILRFGAQTVTMSNWLPPFGISFTADLLGITFAITATIACLAVAAYGESEFNATERKYGFYPLLLFTLAGVTGAFLTGDIFNLYVWFEIMLISSFGLTILGSGRLGIEGALKYSLLNILATSLFLLATGLLYGVIGTLNMADIITKAATSPHEGQLIAIATIYLLAFAMKAAAAPVYFWLPASYHTPRIVVSALFAGLLTKVGVYALLRIFIMLLPFSHKHLADIIMVIVLATMLIGAFGALAQNNIRKSLSYLIISGIGIALVGLALPSQEALTGSILYVIHSMIALTAINLVVGIMISLKGTDELTKLGGLYERHPLVSYLFLIISFAIIGLPPFSGYWPKVLLVNAALSNGFYLLATTILVTSLLNMICLGRIWLYVFWRDQPDHKAKRTGELPKKSLNRQLLSSAFLTAIMVVIGLFPGPLLEVAIKASYTTVINPSGYINSVFPNHPAGIIEPEPLQPPDLPSSLDNNQERPDVTSDAGNPTKIQAPIDMSQSRYGQDMVKIWYG